MSATISAEATGLQASKEAPTRAVSRRVMGVLNVLFPLVVVGIIWEAVARSGLYTQVLFPPLSDVLRATARLMGNGVLERHLVSTLYRLLIGFVLAAGFGIPLGLLMARSRAIENFWVPIVSILNPIPGLAWVPLFILWFGLGDMPTILLVAWASFPPMVFNTWTGSKTINEIWVRAAQSMGAQGLKLFTKVVMPGALPFVLTGMRIGLARSWRAVVAGEMLSAGAFGLGWLIFEARDFVRTDVMLSGVMAIGVIGLLLEKVLFQAIEKYTVVRWGMLQETSA
jgi:NitT/TauT family transport system permease protein